MSDLENFVIQYIYMYFGHCICCDSQNITEHHEHLGRVLTIFDWFEAAVVALGSKMHGDLCTAPSLLNFAKIPMIFCTHVSCVVPECSAKNAQDSAKCVVAILRQKNHTFALFSQSILVTAKKHC